MMSKQHKSYWSDLPSELMELILQRLTLVEYLKCCNVCQSWRAMVNAAISIKGRISLKPQFPFILSLPTYPFHPINLLSLTENKLYTWAIPKLDENLQCPQKFNDGYPYHYTYQFSSFDGWLIVQDFFEEIALGLSYCLIYFNDPMSNDMFMLPKLSLSSHHGHYQIYQLSQMAVSYKVDCKDLIVASLVSIKCEGELNQQLFLCDVGDKSWTRIERQEFFFDIVIHGSKLYAIGQDGGGDRFFEYVMVFNIGDHNAITSQKLVMQDFNPTFSHLYFEEDSFIAKDSRSGDLLLVIYKGLCDFNGNWPREFHIFKLDMSGPRWLKVDNLSDLAILLDDTGIQVISTKNLDCPMKEIRDNCVYFCLSHEISYKSLPDRRIGVFNLIDNVAVVFPCDPSSMVPGHNLWFTPTLR